MWLRIGTGGGLLWAGKFLNGCTIGGFSVRVQIHEIIQFFSYSVFRYFLNVIRFTRTFPSRCWPVSMGCTYIGLSISIYLSTKKKKKNIYIYIYIYICLSAQKETKSFASVLRFKIFRWWRFMFWYIVLLQFVFNCLPTIQRKKHTLCSCLNMETAYSSVTLVTT
jgi:hypothetical protein